MYSGALRTDWTRAEIAALFDLPFMELMWRAQAVHRQWHAAGEVQLCTLLSVKTGGCPEDCGYCSQSVHHKSGLNAGKLMDASAVLSAAADAKAAGSQRFCMGAAWREPKDRDMDKVVEMVKGVRARGLETCMTLGMLSDEQTRRLKEAGLDYYNHNIDTSPENYGNVITTRTFQDRLDTLERCERQASPCAAAVSSAWARAAPIASASSMRWQRYRITRRACPSTRWCRSRAQGSATACPMCRRPASTTSSSFAR
jgi:biotin synthase